MMTRAASIFTTLALSTFAAIAATGCAVAQEAEGPAVDIEESTLATQAPAGPKGLVLAPRGPIVIGPLKAYGWLVSLPEGSAPLTVQKSIIDGACAFNVGYALDTTSYYPEYRVIVQRAQPKGALLKCDHQGYLLLGKSYAIPQTDLAWRPSAPSTGRFVAAFTKMSTPLCDPILDLPIVTFSESGFILRQAKVRATGTSARIDSGALTVLPGSGSVHVAGTKAGTIPGEFVPATAVPPLDGTHYEAHFDTLFNAGASDPAPDYVAGW